MSIKSYRRNVEKNVAGPHLPVCFPASLEQVSPYHSYRPGIYNEYVDFVEWFSDFSIEERKTQEIMIAYDEMIDRLVRPLGGLAIEDVIFKKISTPIGLIRAVNQLVKEDCRIVMDIRYGSYNSQKTAHSVGVVPVQPGYVTLVSTHVPKELRGVIPVPLLADKLAINREKHHAVHPASTANVLGIPN